MDMHATELGERSDFYHLVREVSGRLVGCQGEEIDVAVDDCLEKIGKYFRSRASSFS